MSSEHESTVIFGGRADLCAERKRKRDESGDWDKLSHPDLRSVLQQKERLGNILMKYYPTLLHLPADAMPETPPVGNHSYTVKPAECCKIMVKLDNSSFVVKGLGQSQKFGFGMPLSERVMPGLVAVAWAEAQRSNLMSRPAAMQQLSHPPRMPLPEAKQHWLGGSSALIDFDSSTDWIRCSNNCAPAVGCLAVFPNGGFFKLQLLLAS